jgi:hypothetical protein
MDKQVRVVIEVVTGLDLAALLTSIVMGQRIGSQGVRDVR